MYDRTLVVFENNLRKRRDRLLLMYRAIIADNDDAIQMLTDVPPYKLDDPFNLLMELAVTTGELMETVRERREYERESNAG